MNKFENGPEKRKSLSEPKDEVQTFIDFESTEKIEKFIKENRIPDVLEDSINLRNDKFYVGDKEYWQWRNEQIDEDRKETVAPYRIGEVEKRGILPQQPQIKPKGSENKGYIKRGNYREEVHFFKHGQSPANKNKHSQ